jgi:tetratricopeptide (TPR) repeat protein
VALAAAVLLAYWPALGGGLVWDDAGHLTRPELRGWGGLARIWFEPGATQQWYPLLHSAFWLEHRLWGDAAAGYHAVNVLLHVLAAYLAVRLVRRLALPGAWLAGFAFALHPVCVEAVAWIAEQKSTLSAVFALGAALWYLRYDQSRRPRDYGVALALFVAALLSKTVTAILPGALLAVLWWKRRRLDWRPPAPWFALGLAAGLTTAWVERRYVGAALELNFGERCLLAGRAVWFYLGKLVWPANLMFTYPRWRVDAGTWWQYGFPAALLGLAAALWARRARGALAALLIFVGTLFPALGFFAVYPFRYSFVADHFAYLASLAVLIPAAAWAARRRWAWAAVAVLGVLTFRQAGMYRDAETLYRETVARNPGDWMGWNNLGMMAAERPGGAVEAAADFEAALRANPALADARLNLANALAEIPGREAEAAGAFHTAMAERPESAEWHLRLGAVLERAGRAKEAAAEYGAAVRLEPGSAEAHNRLGSVLTGMPALAEFETAARLDPQMAEPHYNLGMALAGAGRLAEAEEEFARAVALRPDLAPARVALERLRARRGVR